MIGAASPTPEQLAADLLDAALVHVAELSSVVARVVVELPEIHDDMQFGADRLALRGQIEGPFCEYASTLTAGMALRNVGSRPDSSIELASVTCEATIPDPCFWTPQLPHRYRLKLELACGNDVLARHERWLGLRPLSVRGRGFWFDGAGWVLRAADRALLPGAELSHWRDASLAMLVRSPDDALCDAASRFGVLLVADIAGTSQQIFEQLQRLARHAAVGLAIVDATEPLDIAVRRAAGGIVIVRRVASRPKASSNFPSPPAGEGGSDDSSSLPGEGSPSGATGSASALPHGDRQSGPQALLVDANDLEHDARRAANSSLPLLVERKTEACPTLAAARRACDVLQADTAGRGDIAGYLVRAVAGFSKH